MKKLFIVALMAVTVATSAFAAGTKNTTSASLYSFTSEFKDAENVSWTKTDAFTKATFTLNGTKTEAFYNASGELIAKTNGVELAALPVSAKRTIAKSYSSYTIKEAIRFEGESEDAYFVSVENEKETVILKVGEDQFVTVFQKTAK